MYRDFQITEHQTLKLDTGVQTSSPVETRRQGEIAAQSGKRSRDRSSLMFASLREYSPIKTRLFGPLTRLRAEQSFSPGYSCRSLARGPRSDTTCMSKQRHIQYYLIRHSI